MFVGKLQVIHFLQKKLSGAPLNTNMPKAVYIQLSDKLDHIEKSMKVGLPRVKQCKSTSLEKAQLYSPLFIIRHQFSNRYLNKVSIS